ncbi:hypothetical protein DFJ73DRAFT_780221 [Zopfochytrium polystomum]|nr:hypothetical protein DFJ73DRAFT_780221 [Zopfochytrium polystomum]
MKSFLPIAVAFLLAVVAANAAPVPIDVQAVEQFESYGDYMHGQRGHNPSADAQRRQDMFKKEREEEKKIEAKEKAERKAAKEAAKAAKAESSGKKGKGKK